MTTAFIVVGNRRCSPISENTLLQNVVESGIGYVDDLSDSFVENISESDLSDCENGSDSDLTGFNNDTDQDPDYNLEKSSDE